MKAHLCELGGLHLQTDRHSWGAAAKQHAVQVRKVANPLHAMNACNRHTVCETYILCLVRKSMAGRISAASKHTIQYTTCLLIIQQHCIQTPQIQCG